MVLADEANFITFALITNGTNLGLSVQTITDGVATTVFDQASFNEYQNPMYLRLTRGGVSYIAYYSGDGVVWTQTASFTYVRVPTLIGPFAGNYNRHSVQSYSCRHGHQLVQHSMTCIRSVAVRVCCGEVLL